ncbi:serine kinase [Cordyceps militaris]|uniref:Serine kinase n=1 Tax=Cordyceps militaris TaxID=73501 RepID=A0A2H4SKN6_CORMI|nr:serine kinase [Cordyceps militaris]
MECNHARFDSIENNFTTGLRDIRPLFTVEPIGNPDEPATSKDGHVMIGPTGQVRTPLLAFSMIPYTAGLGASIRDSVICYMKAALGLSANSVRGILQQHGWHATGAGNGRQCVVQPSDEFTLYGPNGIHMYLVFESMEPSVNIIVEKLPQFKPGK